MSSVVLLAGLSAPAFAVPYGMDARNGCNSATHSCVTSLTTNVVNEIVLCVGEFSNTGTTPSFSSTHLTFIARGGSPVHSGTGGIWGYYAYALAASTLSAESINFTTKSATSTSVTCASFEGTKSAFDTHSGLPVVAQSIVSSAPSITGLATSTSVPLVVSMLALSATGQAGVPGGFAVICTNSPTCPTSQGTRSSAAYAAFTSAQTATTVTWPTAVAQWVDFTDALVPATLPPSGGSTLPLFAFLLLIAGWSALFLRRKRRVVVT